MAWHHDGAAKGPKPIGFGNRFIPARLARSAGRITMYLPPPHPGLGPARP